MGNDSEVAEQNLQASQAEWEDLLQCPYLAADNGISRMSSNKDLAAKCDDVIASYRRYGRYVPPKGRS